MSRSLPDLTSLPELDDVGQANAYANGFTEIERFHHEGRNIIRYRSETGTDSYALVALPPVPVPDDEIHGWLERPMYTDGVPLAEHVRNGWRDTTFSSCGPFRCWLDTSGRGVLIRYYSADAWQLECLWHQFWEGANTEPRAHGYGRIRRDVADDLQPPTPPMPDLRKQYTWADLLRMATEQNSGVQLALAF